MAVSGPNYLTSIGTLGGGTGTWATNDVAHLNADDASYAVWTKGTGTNTTSPGLECYGFGTFTGVGASDTINSVLIEANSFVSNTSRQGAWTYELWDGTAARIGAVQTGTNTTTTSNVDSFTITGVTYSQLATLRLRVYAHGGGTSTSGTSSCDYVRLSVNYTAAQNATAAPGTVTSAATVPAATARVPVNGPALELSGFGTFTGVGSGDGINYVTAVMNVFTSDAAMDPPTFQLWDGASAQIGTTQTGAVSTDSAATWTANFTGVSYSQLGTLRLRVYGHSGSAAATATLSVDYAALTVSYNPAGGQNATAAPGAVTSAGAIPAVTVSGSATAAPAAVAKAATVPAVTASASATAAPAAVAKAAAVPQQTAVTPDATVIAAAVAKAATVPAVTVTVATNATAAPDTVGKAATVPAAAARVPVTSPALELSGFGTFTGVGASDTINSVTVAVNRFQSDAAMDPATVELWDAASARIGAAQTGADTTSSANTESFTFTGVTYAQLATLRVRVYGHSGDAAAGATESVDYASLTVSYTPAAGGDATAAPATVAKAATVLFDAAGSSVTIELAADDAFASGSAVPAVTVTTGATATPGTVAKAATVPQQAASTTGSANAIPDPVAKAASVPAVTVTVATNATAAPAALAETGGVPAVTASGGATAAPAAIGKAATVPAVTASGEVNAAVTPGTVAKAATVPQQAASTTGSANAIPDPVAKAASVPAVTASGGATAAPAAVAGAGTVPAPSASGSAEAAPGAVSKAATVPQVSVQAGGGATAAPACVAAAGAIPAPTVRQDRTVTPGAVACAALVRAVTVATWTDATAAPACVARAAAVPAAAGSAGATATVAAVTLTATVLAAQVARQAVFGTASHNGRALTRAGTAGRALAVTGHAGETLAAATHEGRP